MAERSRRAKKNTDKLAAYKRAREGGKRDWKVDEDVALYDEVTEDQYKSIVRGRLQEDDFVVDDGVSGYMDNGMDDWGHNDVDEEDEEEERSHSTRKSKKRTGDAVAKSKAKSKAPPPPVAQPSISAYRPAVSAEQEDDFMANLLGGIESGPSLAPKRTKKRKPSPLSDYDDVKPVVDSSPVPYRERKSSRNLNYDSYSPKKKARVDKDSTAVIPAIKRMGELAMHSGSEDASMDFDDVDMEEFMKIDDIDEKPTLPIKKELPATKLDSKPIPKIDVAKQEAGVPSWLSVYDSLAVTTDDMLGSGSSSKSKSSVDALNEDGTLYMFWLDHLEHNGKLYLVGKVKDKSSGTWVSACLAIGGMQRNLFVLPRQLRVMEQENEAGETEIVDTDVVPERQDVYDDFDRIRRKLGIKAWKARWVKRKYAFDMKDVPKEAEWMKVLYSYEGDQIPMDACSPNIFRIFGTNTSIFEIFVLKRKIMGPCWLVIKDVNIDASGISWCKLEANVSSPKDVSPMGDGAPEPPPLTIMSLAVRTVLNHQENKREIVCVSGRIWRDVRLDDPTPPEQLQCTVHTLVRPLDRFPPKFEEYARANGRSIISPMQNERMLLNNLLMTIYKADPDVLIGHDFLGVSLDVLLGRMKDTKTDHWSRLGRFRRAKWIPIGRQGTNIRFMAGRLLCDLASEGARSMIASTTWSLTEMCKSHLKSDRQDIDADDTATYFDGSLSSPDMLMTFVRHCELDAHYQMAIASKVQILPLTKQLTNLAGNAWNKTLNGGRAERNEYILLHEFHRLKYICPDKTFGKKAPKPDPDADEDGEGGGGKGGKSRRDKYKGGLVFEPKRGLWDKYILVMDFNSLYPSIIQEYNIDFTTVDRSDNDADETIPDPPDSHIPQGVLPRLIATLVQRRRQVKSLMKDRSVPHAKLLQYDIKQQALKLTANSMYGCLGFEYSRFYARPLAALTTFKGREILTHTRELAETLQLDVVYGDTDSVFVNSNVTELSEALKISAEFKRAVNNQYKLLEIDLDGIFARLLLLQKKKYAALKVEEGTRTSIEVKGLDMKRREYCALSKNVSQYVLDQILSGEATEFVVQNIHEYLTTIGLNVRSGKVNVEEFIIHKRLGKNPEDYPDAKSQPHVQVALRMKAKGGSARSGDVIPYVFCIGNGEEPSKTAQADRARHPDELKKAAPGELDIDYEHYLANQILPPIERLCDPIEGTDRTRLAECLAGLDPSRYRTAGSGGGGPAFATLESQIPDSERFKDCQPFFIRCRKCKGEAEFRPIWERESSVLQPTGPACLACSSQFPTISLQTQLEVQIRARIAQYYLAWLICGDSTCANRTRSMKVYGRRCLRLGCEGIMRYEYSDADLYNQLKYFQSLFDGDKAKKAALGSASSREVGEITNNENCIQFFKDMNEIVNKYLERCGRRWVDLNALFSGMKL
ncbi:hypothetical protein BKA82DRAFT_955077 [Pisolithus tinctorius]|uniref:DNA polymerase n=1 Tax=Pisolithus tinctorius Marx 270 TaxID=870435 RepID=A0A0C3J2W3_PISTI|nr:hypothetical protein BKA82DRAFT_955077 [Pisolithus tinctorius]KIO03393.1 hypothetical protein M404DRAFT_955077 [Pisolithus tinctorius Marx 270]